MVYLCTIFKQQTITNNKQLVKMNHTEFTYLDMPKAYDSLIISSDVKLSDSDEKIRNKVNDSFTNLFVLTEILSKLFMIPEELKKEISGQKQLPIDTQSSLLLDNFNTSAKRIETLSFFFLNIYI